jgi:hypothetical protein
MMAVHSIAVLLTLPNAWPHAFPFPAPRCALDPTFFFPRSSGLNGFVCIHTMATCTWQQTNRVDRTT